MEDGREEYLPFVRSPVKPTLYSICKSGFCGVFLLPVRLVGILSLILVTYTIIGRLLLIGVDLDKPLTGFRKFYFLRFMRWVMRWVLFLMGFHWIDIKGTISSKDLPSSPSIIVSNHLSYLDILTLGVACESLPGFVAKKETLNAPMIGPLSKLWGCIYCDQLATTGVTAQIQKRAIQRNERPLVVFPEGTTTNGKYLIDFHSGAFVGGHPVRPVTIRYPHHYFNPAWETIKTTSHLFHLLTQFHNHCEIEFLPPYLPSPLEQQQPKLYSQNIMKVMQQKLKVPIIHTDYKQKLDYHKIVIKRMEQYQQLTWKEKLKQFWGE